MPPARRSPKPAPLPGPVLRRLPAGRNWPACGAATRPSSPPPFYSPPTVREHSLNDTAARPAAEALHQDGV